MIPVAGCLESDPAVEELLEASESSSFDAEAGEEYDVTIASGEDGVSASIEHTGEQEDEEGRWEWNLDTNEEATETIEIPSTGEYIVSVEEGSAFVTVE